MLKEGSHHLDQSSTLIVQTVVEGKIQQKRFYVLTGDVELSDSGEEEVIEETKGLKAKKKQRLDDVVDLFAGDAEFSSGDEPTAEKRNAVKTPRASGRSLLEKPVALPGSLAPATAAGRGERRPANKFSGLGKTMAIQKALEGWSQQVTSLESLAETTSAFVKSVRAEHLDKCDVAEVLLPSPVTLVCDGFVAPCQGEVLIHYVSPHTFTPLS
jgi:hypothetical protein